MLARVVQKTPGKVQVEGMTEVSTDDAPERERRLLVLERLLAIEAVSYKEALERAATMISETMDAEKVDAFVFSPVRSALVALGVSDTRLGHHQREIGLDVLPVDRAGTVGEVYGTGQPVLYRDLTATPHELPEIVDALGVRSVVAVPLQVSDARRGVLSVTSTRCNAFDRDDLVFLRAVSHWVGLTARRSLAMDRAAGATGMRHRSDSSAEAILRLTQKAEEQRVVADRARQLAETVQGVARGDAALRDRVLSVVAHDLRTPLTNMRGRAQLILRRITRGGDLSTEWLREQVESLEASTDRLLNMVQELTDASAVAHGQPLDLRTETLNLVELICTIVDEMTPSVEVELLMDAPEEPICIRGDRARLLRVVQNLLDNAVKFSPAGSAVGVRVKRVDGPAVVSVQDEGVGIPANELDKVFEPYYRASTSAGVEGTGLGLAAARTVIEQHGGTIEIASQPGAGTTVTIQLPATEC